MVISIYLRERRRLSVCLLDFFTMCEAVAPICGCAASTVFWIVVLCSAKLSGHCHRADTVALCWLQCAPGHRLMEILPWAIGRAPSPTFKPPHGKGVRDRKSSNVFRQ
ncbi:hypothetical protein Nepgr_019536 [Nepenthes gracilis]|uniref:Uncharacterized protein n=1 Tax=Nepenthes gracilis TaxID=150966 RepID=A0AAD3SV90_NEPGR|nr:hypothetical protein Nepgr_019536 [Nepenthes gracilis]